MSLCKFNLHILIYINQHNGLTYIYCEVVTIVSLASSISYKDNKKRKQKIAFLGMRTHRTDSSNHFRVYCTAALITPMLHLTPPYLLILYKSLYLLTTFLQSFNSCPPPARVSLVSPPPDEETDA